MNGKRELNTRHQQLQTGYLGDWQKKMPKIKEVWGCSPCASAAVLDKTRPGHNVIRLLVASVAQLAEQLTLNLTKAISRV